MIQFKENHAYHCKTLEQAKWLLKKAHEQGFRWGGGSSYLCEYNRWNEYMWQTCYNICNGTFQDKPYFKKSGYTIIKVSELPEYQQHLKQQNMKNIEIEITEGYEIDIETSNLKEGKISFKKIESKYPMKFEDVLKVYEFYIDGNTKNNSFITEKFGQDLLLFGQLVQTCREWNKIDGWENKWNEYKGVIICTNNCVAIHAVYNISTPIAFKDEKTAELFLSTFRTELEQVKELL